MPRARRTRSRAAVRNIGFLLATTPDDWDEYIDWFETALKRDIKVTYLPPEGANGDPQAIDEAAVVLAKYYKVIVTASTAAALALKKATENTAAQFVYASVGDPDKSGLEPTAGGKFTGGSNQQIALVKRRVDHMLGKPTVFKEKFAIVGDDTEAAHKQAMTDAFDLLKTTKQVVMAPITSKTDIAKFIDDLDMNEGVKSLYVCSDLNLTVNSKKLNQEAHKAGMKTMYEFEAHKKKHGGDDFEGDSWQSLFEQAADYVDKILKGTPAGDLKMYTTKKKRRPATKSKRARR